MQSTDLTPQSFRPFHGSKTQVLFNRGREIKTHEFTSAPSVYHTMVIASIAKHAWHGTTREPNTTRPPPPHTPVRALRLQASWRSRERTVSDTHKLAILFQCEPRGHWPLPGWAPAQKPLGTRAGSEHLGEAHPGRTRRPGRGQTRRGRGRGRGWGRGRGRSRSPAGRRGALRTLRTLGPHGAIARR